MKLKTGAKQIKLGLRINPREKTFLFKIEIEREVDE